MFEIGIYFYAETNSGELRKSPEVPDSIWIRVRSAAASHDAEAAFRDDSVRLVWPALLNVVRELAPLQRERNFRFMPHDRAAELIRRFVAETKSVRQAIGTLSVRLSETEIDSRLAVLGWDLNKRQLKPFQKRDLAVLVALSNGANFSVPGAGKTTVSLALHLLTRPKGGHLFVVAPKNAFSAWKTVIGECISATAPPEASEPFYVLAEDSADVIGSLESSRSRFLISYDQLVRHQSTVAAYMARHMVHLIIDESHRMKAGINTLRGAALLRLGILAIRRDILTGTPMPQSSLDLKPQLDFLWPGTGLGIQIEQGRIPRDVIGPLYVRTTKQDLGLPAAVREPVFVQMGEAHRAFYSLVKSVSLQQLSGFRSSGQVDITRARNCVMRLLQVSSNPILAIESMAGEVASEKLGPMVRAVVEEGISRKLLKSITLARSLVNAHRKVVIWTIFTENVALLEAELADLNAVVIDGSVPTGSSSDISTREGRIRRFHEQADCSVMIANPAAASEGMSLHTVCHDAIYVDRSYNATHYLQSLDRIHRLGIPPDTKTTAYLLLNQTPAGIGSIDYSVSRRLAKKIRQMQEALNDTDLHEIALDEESIPVPVDPAVTIEDLVDLVEELEGRKPFDVRTDIE